MWTSSYAIESRFKNGFIREPVSDNNAAAAWEHWPPEERLLEHWLGARVVRAVGEFVERAAEVLGHEAPAHRLQHTILAHLLLAALPSRRRRRRRCWTTSGRLRLQLLRHEIGTVFVAIQFAEPRVARLLVAPFGKKCGGHVAWHVEDWPVIFQGLRNLRI